MQESDDCLQICYSPPQFWPDEVACRSAVIGKLRGRFRARRSRSTSCSPRQRSVPTP